MARAATTSDAYNAIAEPHRRQILTILQTGEHHAGELADSLGLQHPAASKHLRVLREVGLVRVRREGRRRVYGLDARGLRTIHEWTGGFEQFWEGSFDRLNEYLKQIEADEEVDANDR